MWHGFTFLSGTKEEGYMKFNKLKRKLFFWVDKLQISRGERIAFTLLLSSLALLFLMNRFLSNRYNYNQEEYDQILTEFEKRTAEIRAQKEELDEVYTPQAVQQDADKEEGSLKSTDSQSPQTEQTDAGEPAIIDLNNAGSKELQKLDGVGPAYAERIIEYREKNGGFDSIDELVNVKGIGKKRLENLRPFIKVEN